MSLVHQALRKAEQEKQRKVGFVPAVAAVPVLPAAHPIAAPLPAPREPVATPVTVPAPAPTPSSWHVLPVLLSCVAFVAIVAIVVMVARNRVPASVETKAAPPAPVAEAAPAEPRAPEVTQPAAVSSTADADKYQLSGIAQEPDGQPVAVINGQPRHVDQFIDGAVVKKIERDRVTLDVNGRTVVKRLF